MLKTLQLDKFTVFQSAALSFGKNLNVIVGENGTGKTHILKAAYSGIAASAGARFGFGRGGWGEGEWGAPSKSALEVALAAKFQGVFRPDGVGRLVRRGRGKARLRFEFADKELDFAMSISSSAGERSMVALQSAPTRAVEKLPVFLPTRELLSIHPGFVSIYETTHLPFEETWRDTSVLLGAPLARGTREERIKELLTPLEAAMGGSVTFDESGRFYLNPASGRMEIHLVAEGLRKLATVAQLIATGSSLDSGYLFWDEPDANLNPKIIKMLAKTILQVAQSGIQVFVATHSLFLMRELHILQQREYIKSEVRFFGLSLAARGAASVRQGKSIDDIGDIASLDEDLEQSDRYLNLEMGVMADAGPEEK